jgi:aspartate kinase
MRCVMKFGGTSVREFGYLKIYDIISSLKKDEIVIVVSALKGVTDALLEAARRAEAGEERWIDGFLRDFRKQHVLAAIESIGNVPSRLKERLAKADQELEQALHGILHLREASPRSMDYVVSFGERYSADITAAMLTSNGLKAKPFTGGEAGITTNDRFGEATPLGDVTRQNVSSRISPLLEGGTIPVVGGFSGMTPNGIITTLGRGGSDYTATILANALHADQVIIWSDVDGIMTADPKIIPEAVTIPEITYAEAMEMAVLGAKSLHPRVLEPIVDDRIPVKLKNTFNPGHEGTMIVSKTSRPFPSALKVISLIRDVGMLAIRGASMVGEPGTAARFFTKIAESGINIMMISQSVSESNISVVMKRPYLRKAHEVVNEYMGRDQRLEVEDDISVIAALGEGMRGTPGIAAKMFGAVADAGINVRMIASGSSELNISFIVKEAEGIGAAKALHREFIERAFK